MSKDALTAISTMEQEYNRVEGERDALEKTNDQLRDLLRRLKPEIANSNVPWRYVEEIEKVLG